MIGSNETSTKGESVTVLTTAVYQNTRNEMRCDAGVVTRHWNRQDVDQHYTAEHHRHMSTAHTH